MKKNTSLPKEKHPSLNTFRLKKRFHNLKEYFSTEELSLFYLLTEQAVTSVLTLDLDGYITYANKIAEAVVQIPSDKKQVSFTNYIEKKYIKKANQYFRRVKKGESLLRYELNIIDKKDVVIPVEFTASPIYKNKKIIQVLIIVRDIRRRKQFEHLVTESEKTKALQHLIAGTTYEIHHPLKGLLDHSQNLLNKYSDRNFEYIGFKEFKNIMHTIETMRDQIKYCFDTSSHLMDIHRRKVGMKEKKCDINKSIRNVLKMVSCQQEICDIKFQLKLASKLPLAAIDSLEFTQVITNLITNAIQSIPSNGLIYLKTTYFKKMKMICIECRDTGVGIPKENLAYVFDPFFTTKNRGLEKSSGLGLAIVYSIIQSFDGAVSLKSSLREGTSIKISLPAYQKNA